ncbi:Polyglutamate biosynthesis protein [Aspergillus sp. HF37]|nr:Polyglutamate biosynthesis protein [Aspergillus sp. HF37]
MPAPRAFTLTFVGDVMLGRLVDQLWPQHVDNAREQRIITTFIERHPYLASYTHRDPWGSALRLFHASDLNLINLETAATTTNTPWPNKTFNYRMHPANTLAALKEADIDYVCLANNHTLDFGTDGLVETIWTLKEGKVPFAGAGETTDESRRPAVLSLPSQKSSRIQGSEGEGEGEGGGGGGGAGQGKHKIHVFSATDHPKDWAAVPTFHLIDYSATSRRHLKNVLTAAWPSSAADGSGIPKPSANNASGPGSDPEAPPALKIFSVHWGPNYAWQPAAEIRALAHFVIDECGVDIVHGHSAHHVQGVERYKGKVIIYGCGDFVDDYALTEEFRNDLGAVWRVVVSENDGGGLGLERLDIFPSRIDRFQASLLDADDEDHGWVRRTVGRLSRELGTSVRPELGGEGQIVVDLGE